MKTIRLTNSDLVALVDDEDYPLLVRIKWFNSNGYARNSKCSMHALILGFPKFYIPDHIDHNTLNNQKSNLRRATQQTNRFNQVIRKGTICQYKGVSTSMSKKNPYKAGIGKTIDGRLKRFHLGCFLTQEEAARAYDAKAVELFGEFACLNFPR